VVELEADLLSQKSNNDAMAENFNSQMAYLRGRLAASTEEVKRLSQRADFETGKFVELAHMGNRLSDDFSSLKAVLRSGGNLVGDVDYRIQLLQDGLYQLAGEFQRL
ncbi:unnamed protein product, partial [Ostreobium quekettii]